MSVSTVFCFLLSNCPHNNSHFQKGRQYRGQSLSPHACSLAKNPLTGQESNTDYYTAVHRIHLCLGVSVLKQNTFCWSTWRVLKDWWQYFKNLYGTFSFFTYPFKEKIFHMSFCALFSKNLIFSYQLFERKLKNSVEILCPCILENYCFILDL